MIQEFIDLFMANKEKLKEQFSKNPPGSYKAVVRGAILLLKQKGAWNTPDPQRITEIDYGDYQGTLLYIIAASDYQPNNYWFVKVDYGSCSGCDTLQAIDEYETLEERTNGYITLALHIMQGLKRLE